jgi:hypothetical protein
MNPNAQFEHDLEQWLQTAAPASAPAGFHAMVMGRARTLRQRPGWATTFPIRRFGRRRGMTLLAAAALLLVGGGVLAASAGLLRLPTVVPPVPAPSLVAIATASPDSTTTPTPRESPAPTASPITVADPGGTWIPTGRTSIARTGYTAIRLLDGRVLMVGGHYRASEGGDAAMLPAEVYDPSTGAWSAAGSISKQFVAATLLREGKVLVLVEYPDGPGSAEVYDPESGTWTATSRMDPDLEHVTMLPDGRVLATGTGRAQVYDPTNGTWTATGPMALDAGGTYTVLRDGHVLVADWDGAQVYDPATGTWTATGRMAATGKKNEARYGASATLLPDGKVLLAGGMSFSYANDYGRLDSAEVYDPVTDSWTATTNMPAPTSQATSILQPDGRVLVIGTTFSPGSSVFSAVDVYDPATGTWTALSVEPGVRYDTATLLSDGTVLVTGEVDGGADAACKAALYDPRTGSLTNAPSTLRCGTVSMTPLLDGTVLAAGGCGDYDDEGRCVSNPAAQLYVPAGVPLPWLPASPPPPPVMPDPTPEPTPLPPAAGPVPPNARSWKVTVDNRSSEPATVFVVQGVGEDGLPRLVGSATPNVVPAGTSRTVTFLFPVIDGRAQGWIDANLRPGEGGGLIEAAQIGIPGKMVITEDGGTGWLGP